MSASLEHEVLRDARVREAIPRRGATDSVPPSFSQQRLWFIEQLEPGTHLYNTARAVRLRGALDTAVLRRSLDALVARHESLRTSFSAVDGRPVQVIAPSVSLPLPVADLADFPELERTSRAEQLAEEEIRRPFELTRAPLLRARLIRLRPEEHILVLTLHHIVSDGWSMGVLHRELAALYDALLRGTEPVLPPLPIQYADFAVWQRGWLQGERLARELAYWRERLKGAPPLLELPTDRPRPPVQTFAGAHEDFLFSPELSQGVAALTRAEGATPFMALLAAFQALLGRYTGQDDIVVGSPIAGRTRTETEGLIGFFVNTLALRTDLSGDPTFRQLLGRVRETCFGAYDHQGLPFERLVEELRPERSLSHSALFQVMFALQNAPTTLPRLAGLDVSPVGLGRGIARFDLTLYLRDDHGALRAMAEYNTDLFDRATIARMMAHFQVLLSDAVTCPDRRLSELRILTDAESRQALVEWNPGATELPGPVSVHEMIEAQARQTPDAVAAVFEGEELSYRELDRRAERLARHLRARGAGPDAVVGLCLEPSLETLIGILGILKAGAAYLPLDPESPARRLDLMLSDAAVPVVVTRRALLGVLPHGRPATVCLDDADRWDPGADAPAGSVAGEQGAYVIYTSGSTGRPKGVQVTHRALVNLLRSIGRLCGVDGRDVVLALSPLTFDIATLELLLPLTVGGRVAIVSRETARDGRLLAGALARTGATVMQATPATWRMLVDSGWSGAKGLKALSGGEALPHELAQALLARGVVLWNLYGPTETTIYSAGAPVRAGEPPMLENRIPNTRLYLLDRHLSPVPVGVPGELYIGGAGLARGYLGRPALTGERFVPDPFSGEPGARMYRTGDLLRRRANGALEFLGRTDHQVKLRGFRIELGEIEATLAAHPRVRQVVVLLREDEPGDRRLVAYAVPAAGEPPAQSDLRGHLGRTLPDYMVPSAIVLLEDLPRTANGKLDRAALPAPDRRRPEPSAEHAVPMSALEQVLAEICGEVLGISAIGAHDDFFALGGHSLLATRVVSRIEAVLGIELPLRHLFEAPTVAGLAERIVALEQAGALGS